MHLYVSSILNNMHSHYTMYGNTAWSIFQTQAKVQDLIKVTTIKWMRNMYVCMCNTFLYNLSVNIPRSYFKCNFFYLQNIMIGWLCNFKFDRHLR